MNQSSGSSKYIPLVRRIPLTVKAIVLTIVIGLAAWMVMDFIQTEHLEVLLHRQLREQLELQAHRDRKAFDDYFRIQGKTVKLFATQKKFLDHLEELERKGWNTPNGEEVIYHHRPPEWYPKISVARALVNARYVLLLDSNKCTREIYGRGTELPEAFLEPVGLLNLLTHNENYMTEADGKPYLISTETVLREDGSIRAILMFVNPIDSDFLISIYGPPVEDRAVALMGGLPLRVIASSNPNLVHEGTTAGTLSGRFIASGKSFFDYGASDLLIQFTSFIPTSEVEALTRTMLNTTRRHRAVTAILLIASFAVILFVITSRIDRLTRRVVDFAVNSLGREPHQVQHGDQLMVLDEEFRNLADGTLAYAEELRQANEELQKALETARAADRIKGEFIQNISHELRTPMSGMIGVTEMLLETGLDEEQRKLLSMILSSSQALLSVINDILDLSSMASGKAGIQTREFDLTTVVETVTGFFGPETHKKDLTLNAEIHHDVPLRLIGDPAHLRQILMYLVGNAVKFTETGSIKIMVNHERQSGNSTWLLFQVTDTGIGISEQDLSSIFKPFYQVDGSATRKYGGTGLGLALASAMVRLMGGSIEVRSETGKGSTFSFSLPFDIQDQATSGS